MLILLQGHLAISYLTKIYTHPRNIGTQSILLSLTSVKHLLNLIYDDKIDDGSVKQSSVGKLDEEYCFSLDNFFSRNDYGELPEAKRKIPRSNTLKCVLVSQSCQTLWDSMDCSPPGSSVHEDYPSKNTGVGCHALPPPGDLLNPGIEPRSPTLQADSLQSESQGSPTHLEPSFNHYC